MVKTQSTKRPRRPPKFAAVMQVRVPAHIREAVFKELDRLQKDGMYKSESDWIREAIVAKLK